MKYRSLGKIERIVVSVEVLVLIGASVPQPVRAVHTQPSLAELPRLERTASLIAPMTAQSVLYLPDPPARPRSVKRTLWVTVTAYSSTVDQTDSDPFTTASGDKVHDGIAAWNAVQFGTEFRLPEAFGDKVFVVKDRLNAQATRYHVDIWMPTREAALQWGARILKVEVL